MRLVFLGTSEYAVPALEAAVADPRFDVALVVSQPDAAAGRGRKVAPSPMAEAAARLGVPLFRPPDVNAPEALERLRAADADVFLTAAYGQKLGPAVLALPRRHALNLHASLLPRHRGASPIQHALLAGDAQTGVTLMTMTARMDAGPVHAQVAVPIAPDDTAGTLTERLALAARDLLRREADAMLAGTLPAREQDESAATRAPSLAKDAGRIDWQKTAVAIDRHVRAMTPWPSAFTFCPGNRSPVRILVVAGEVVDEPSPAMPGTVVAFSSGIEVAAARGIYRLLEVKRSGKRAMPAVDFLRGFPLRVGTRLQ